MGENIGSAARAMLNFGIDNLRIVNPRDGWPNPKAKALASGAGSVLDSALIFDSVQEACQDMHYVFASSARERKLDKKEISLGESISECKNLLDKGLNVGFLFACWRMYLMNSFADDFVEKTSCDSWQAAMCPKMSVSSSYWVALYTATFSMSKYALSDFFMITPSRTTSGYL